MTKKIKIILIINFLLAVLAVVLFFLNRGFLQKSVQNRVVDTAIDTGSSTVMIQKTSPEKINADLKIINGNSGVGFSSSDVNAMAKIDACYRNIKVDQISDDDGIRAATKLVDYAMRIFAMEKLGIMTSSKELSRENKRIINNTKAPEVIKCIKMSVSDDDYLRLFVEPTLLMNMLQSEFINNKDINAEEIEKIEKAKGVVAVAPDKFEQTGTEIGVEVMNQTFPFQDDTMAEKFFASAADINDNLFVKNVLSITAVGQVYDNIVEDDSSYQLVKMISMEEKDGGKIFNFKSIVVPKKIFGNWFKEINKDIVIEVKDSGLHDRLQKSEKTWWAKNVK